MRSIEVSGKSVDAAVFEGLRQLGIAIDEVNITVIQNEKKGVLGIGSKPAIVRLEEKERESILDEISFETKNENNNEKKNERKGERRERTMNRENKPKVQKKTLEEYWAEHGVTDESVEESKDAEITELNTELNQDYSSENIVTTDEQSDESCKPEYTRRPSRNGYSRGRRNVGENRERNEKFTKTHEKINYTEEAAQNCEAAQYVKELIEKMGVEGKVLAFVDEGIIKIKIESETIGVLIGYRGETLDALQYLTSLYANRNHKDDTYTKVTIDTEDYRDKRKESLIRLARRVAYQVKESGKMKALEPMNPYERRILHSTLQNNPYVETYSEGDEPNRHVIVVPKTVARNNQRRERKIRE